MVELLPARDAPAQASAVGYNAKTFDSAFSASTIDKTLTKVPSFDWYPWSFFGNPSPGPTEIQNIASGLLLNGIASPAAQSQIATIAQIAPGQRGWVGKAFGGGAYIEAEFAFDPATVTDLSTGWPAFWLMPWQHLAGDDTDRGWPGQVAGFAHFGELDIFEYSLHLMNGNSALTYATTVISWYDQWSPGDPYSKIQTPFNTLKRTAPNGYDWNAFHKYGALWVPATATTKGYVEHYLDGVAGARVEWDLLNPNSSPPPTQPGAILDQHQHAIIIGTSPGQLLRVRRCRVWQRAEAGNLVH